MKPGPPRAAWHKSTYSGGHNECLEAARLADAALVRDSKDPDRAVLSFSATPWDTFVGSLRTGWTSGRQAGWAGWAG